MSESLATQHCIALLPFLRKLRTDLTLEKRTQQQIYDEIKRVHPNHIFVREHKFDNHNIPDLFCKELGIAIEIKIKGNKKDIYKQCVGCKARQAQLF